MVDKDYGCNYKSICCEQIPELFLDKLVAKNHFSKFGKITRFILRPKRLSCTVEYATEDDAERACMHAGSYNGKEFLVKFAEREVAHVQNTEEWISAEVKAELEAMGPRQRFSAPAYNTRQQTAQVARSPVSRSVKNEVPHWTQKILKTTSEHPKVDPTVRNELEAILRRPAPFDEDKYRVLDARDKLIRLTTVRQTDIKKAIITKGICPDMCPEKERLMREFQRQVSTFEMDSDNGTTYSTISHHRAIKEYSRSSADQEVPLAHELRPEKVLQMTMLYLMHRILDLCDDPQISIADWFHFVWDRTRSIRKDITQQELCSLNTVQLVEQCARFHIHCAARLVAEDPSVFDRKINAENLTKCLQTLKYMYHDLRVKNVPCPCEAEFRSYIVLLNLGDSNFLWELKQLPDSIQNSPHIKRAIGFYIALQNNNYVRFFDMIRSPDTTYLSGCILLGYFTKLRLFAMEAIIKSHNWGKNSIFLPLAYLTKVLGFEDEQAGANFFTYHGLLCEDDRVMLNRLNKPDIEYSMDRAVILIESKRTVTVGECIRGSTLEPAAIFENHQPHNSFDENGVLKPEAWTAEDQLRGERATPKTAEVKKTQEGKDQEIPVDKTDKNIFKIPQISPQISAKHKMQLQQRSGSNSPSSIFGGNQYGDNKLNSNMGLGSSPAEVSSSSKGTDYDTADFSKPTLKLPVDNALQLDTFFNAFRKRSPEIVDSLFHTPEAPPLRDSIIVSSESASKSMWSGVSAPSLHSSSDLKNDMERTNFLNANMNVEEFYAGINKARHDSEEDLQLKVSEEEQNHISVQEVEEVMQDYEYKRRIVELELSAEGEYQSLLDEQIKNIAEGTRQEHYHLEKCSQQVSHRLLNEVLYEEIYEIVREEFADMCHDQMILASSFLHWLQQTRKSIEKRRILQTTPMWVSTETRGEQTKTLLHPCQEGNLQMIKRYRHGQACNFKDLLWHSPTLGLHPTVNIFDIIAKNFARRPAMKGGLLQIRKYFKLILTLPGEMEEIPGFDSLCNKWLQKYVKAPQKPAEHDGPYICSIEHGVALCVRKFSGIVPLNENKQRMRHEGDNADGIICFMSCSNLKSTRKRLHHLLKLSQMHKSLPIGLVVYDNSYDEEQLADFLELDNFIDDGKLCGYKFFGCLEQKSCFSFPGNFRKAVHFVSLKSSFVNSESESLEMQTLQSWLESNLGEEMWQRWHESVLNNIAFNKICSMPQHVVGIYNEALKRLEQITAENFEDMPDFPVELSEFVPPEQYRQLRGLEYFPRDWKNNSRQKMIRKFLKKISLPPLPAEVPKDVGDYELCLLNYANRIVPHDDMKATQAAYLAIKSLIEQLNHDDLQDVLISDRFALISFLPIIKALAFARVNHVLADPVSQKLPAEIIYRRQAIVDYQTFPWWLNYKAIYDVSIDFTALDTSASEQTEVEIPDQSYDNELAQVLERGEETSRRADGMLRDLNTKSLNFHNSPLMRKLDESFYQFELAKQSGAFNVSYVTEIIDELDAQFERALAASDQQDEEPNSRKRKHEDDMSSVMDRALDIIQKVEMRQDSLIQLQKALKLSEI